MASQPGLHIANIFSGGPLSPQWQVEAVELIYPQPHLKLFMLFQTHVGLSIPELPLEFVVLKAERAFRTLLSLAAALQ